MPRPKIPGTETIQTFNCSYALKAGLMRSAELTSHSNPSSLIRAELEESCRRILGDAGWKEVLRGAQDPGRLDALERHLAGWDTRRLRMLLVELKKDGGRVAIAHTSQLLAAMESYWRDLISDRDRPDLAMSIRVTLYEAADVIYKLMRPFRSNPTPKMIQAMLVEARKLPASLRADVEAAILSLPKAKTAKG